MGEALVTEKPNVRWPRISRLTEDSAMSRRDRPLYSPLMESRSQREREHFDSIAADVGSVWWGSITAAGKVRLQERGEIAIRRARLAPGVMVLEPGAGNGEFTTQIAKSGATIIGIDISPRQQELAGQMLARFPNAQVVLADAEEHLAFPDGFFDCVVGNAVLHHLDLSKALPELYRVLKPGGRLCAFEPNMLNPQVALERKVKFVGRRMMNSPDETAFFRWQLRRKLHEQGFVRIDIRPFDFLHPGTPIRLVPAVHGLSSVLGSVPVIREVAGSLQIYAEK
jgi:SAM-dependent methyltransferase